MYAKIEQANLDALRVIHYPDPRLGEISTPLERVDDRVRALLNRMFELMFTGRGVGLAAPQVGINVRLFVASPTFEEDDRQVFINPEILSVEGKQEGEEGCLSVPGVNCRITRGNVVTVRALDAYGEPFEVTAEEMPARIYQHETDHLDGRLLIDRVGTVARFAHRRTLKQLEAEFAAS
jgi:peptide deformylase